VASGQTGCFKKQFQKTFVFPIIEKQFKNFCFFPYVHSDSELFLQQCSLFERDVAKIAGLNLTRFDHVFKIVILP
jgi:hypothetical protein